MKAMEILEIIKKKYLLNCFNPIFITILFKKLIYYLFIQERVQASSAGEDDERKTESERHDEPELDDVISHRRTEAHEDVAWR